MTKNDYELFLENLKISNPTDYDSLMKTYDLGKDAVSDDAPFFWPLEINNASAYEPQIESVILKYLCHYGWLRKTSCNIFGLEDA